MIGKAEMAAGCTLINYFFLLVVQNITLPQRYP